MIPRLVIGTKNPDKLAEMEAVLAETGLVGEIVRGLDWPAVDEIGSSLEENALLKARAVADATGLPALADDTGLEADALGGAPGVYAARYAGPDSTYEQNVELLLSRLDGVTDRSARFRTVVALVFPDGTAVTAEGVLEGEIAMERHGSGGFGYDPVFVVGERTVAELEDGEKNRISHRARALLALARELGAA